MFMTTPSYNRYGGAARLGASVIKMAATLGAGTKFGEVAGTASDFIDKGEEAAKRGQAVADTLQKTQRELGLVSKK